MRSLQLEHISSKMRDCSVSRLTHEYCPVGLRVHSFLCVKRPFSASKDGAYNNVVVWLHGVGEEVRTDGIFKVFIYACLPFETH